jgi:hypothetical protein
LKPAKSKQRIDSSSIADRYKRYNGRSTLSRTTSDASVAKKLDEQFKAEALLSNSNTRITKVSEKYRQQKAIFEANIANEMKRKSNNISSNTIPITVDKLITMRKNVMRSIPKYSRNIFISIAGVTLRRYYIASIQQNKQAMELHFGNFLSIPSMCLS